MSNSASNAARVSQQNGITIITLDHAPRNLLNPENMKQLIQALQDADKDEATAGIVLVGSGDFFCGGLDVPAIQAGADPVTFAQSLAELLSIFPKLGTPVVAAVNGDAVASGASIVAAVDYAVGHDAVRIGTYEVSVGIWPMIAQVPLVQRIGARAAMENIGAGEPFSAQRAYEVGLLQKVVSKDSVIPACFAWLENAARGAAVYWEGRRSLYELSELPYDEAIQLSLDRFTAMFR